MKSLRRCLGTEDGSGKNRGYGKDYSKELVDSFRATEEFQATCYAQWVAEKQTFDYVKRRERSLAFALGVISLFMLEHVMSGQTERYLSLTNQGDSPTKVGFRQEEQLLMVRLGVERDIK